MKCCERDNDQDGNCDIHAAPGILRKKIKEKLLLEGAELLSIMSNLANSTDYRLAQLLVEKMRKVAAQ
jgi:hypothetical protein